MIVSHKYKFIFIRTRKTASTSTEIALSRILGEQDVITPVCERDEKIREIEGGISPQNYTGFYNHMSASEIRAILGEKKWNSYYKFCFERNPWDKVISLYFHRYKQEPRPSFISFIDSGECFDAYNYNLYTINDEIAVDFIGRYEELETNLADVCNRLGINHLYLPRAKSQFRTDKSHYSQFISSNEKEKINMLFKKEIQLHCYQF
ncbi:sulfotransferase family 2 domain-containing protein [Paenibacillus lautus]|uniref:sulfotransferase family 2 domain-containing protein n=1 Tax=Paenibacillus lautus TaxID=1401 RepID=UPI003D2904A2